MTEEREIEEIASGLQSAFGELLIAATREADVRPMTLISVLGLDKSLASRITRAIKSPNPLGSLHLMPTASGLKKVLDAAENADAPADVVQNARHAAKLYGDFLATFAGGRADLDAALATWIPELKDEMLRKARREIFRGWATTTGVRAGTFYSAHFILPGTTPGRLNVAVVSTEADVCRLRSGVPLKIAGFRFAGTSKSPLKNLDGGDLQAAPLGILLKELTTVAPEDCDVSQGADFFKLRILGDRPRINEPVTYSYGIQVADLLPATKCDERDYMWTEFVQLLAVTDFLADFYIHKDVRLDVHPIITRVMAGASEPDVSSEPAVYGDALLEHDLQASVIGVEPGDVQSAAYPHVETMLAVVGEKLGFRPEDLRGYRVHEKYTAPMHRTGVWLELPDPD